MIGPSSSPSGTSTFWIFDASHTRSGVVYGPNSRLAADKASPGPPDVESDSPDELALIGPSTSTPRFISSPFAFEESN